MDSATGVNFTPLWAGFHSGGFDAFTIGEASSSMIEAIAEDGNTQPISTSFLNTNPNYVDTTIVADNSEVPVIQHDQTATNRMVVDSDVHTYVTLLSMIVPSNDAFVGNDDPRSYRLFDDDGQFIPLTVQWVGDDDVYDAGTEVNDEIPANTAFFGQSAPNTGVTEGGVSTRHPGLLPAGSGGIVDDPDFANADFSQNNGVIGSVTIRMVSTTNDDDDDDNSPSSNDDDDNSPSSNDDDDNSPSSNDDDDNSPSSNDDDDDDNSPVSPISPLSPLSVSNNDDDDDDNSPSSNDDDDDDNSSAGKIAFSVASIVALAAMF